MISYLPLLFTFTSFRFTWDNPVVGSTSGGNEHLSNKLLNIFVIFFRLRSIRSPVYTPVE